GRAERGRALRDERRVLINVADAWVGSERVAALQDGPRHLDEFILGLRGEDHLVARSLAYGALAMRPRMRRSVCSSQVAVRPSSRLLRPRAMTKPQYARRSASSSCLARAWLSGETT